MRPDGRRGAFRVEEPQHRLLRAPSFWVVRPMFTWRVTPRSKTALSSSRPLRFATKLFAGRSAHPARLPAYGADAVLRRRRRKRRRAFIVFGTFKTVPRAAGMQHISTPASLPWQGRFFFVRLGKEVNVSEVESTFAERHVRSVRARPLFSSSKTVLFSREPRARREARRSARSASNTSLEGVSRGHHRPLVRGPDHNHDVSAR